MTDPERIRIALMVFDEGIEYSDLLNFKPLWHLEQHIDDVWEYVEQIKDYGQITNRIEE